MNSDTSKLIAMIVDRDTPPDNRNEVIDHDIRGNPITRGDACCNNNCNQGRNCPERK